MSVNMAVDSCVDLMLGMSLSLFRDQSQAGSFSISSLRSLPEEEVKLAEGARYYPEHKERHKETGS